MKQFDDERSTPPARALARKDCVTTSTPPDSRRHPLLPHPRDLVRLGPHDGAHRPAARVAVSVLVPMIVLAAIGHAEWTPYAVFGAFASAFGRGLPRLQRVEMQLEGGLLLVTSVVLGTALSAASAPAWLLVLAIGVTAGVASALSDVRRWSPPGPLFFVFGLGVTAFLPATGGSVAAAAVVAPASLALALLASAPGLLLPSGRRELRTAEGRRWRREPRPLNGRRTVVHATICLVASITAGALSLALGLSSPYWAMVSAVVPVVGTATAGQLARAGHRLLGTLLGVGLAALLLAAHPGQIALIVAFGVLQFATELVVVRNYGLALLFITPMALGMRALGGAPVDVGALVAARAADTAIGVGVVVVVLLLTHRLRRPRTAA